MTAAQIPYQSGNHRNSQEAYARPIRTTSTEPYIPPKDTPARGEAALKFKSVPSRGF